MRFAVLCAIASLAACTTIPPEPECENEIVHISQSQTAPCSFASDYSFTVSHSLGAPQSLDGGGSGPATGYAGVQVIVAAEFPDEVLCDSSGCTDGGQIVTQTDDNAIVSYSGVVDLTTYLPGSGQSTSASNLLLATEIYGPGEECNQLMDIDLDCGTPATGSGSGSGATSGASSTSGTTTTSSSSGTTTGTTSTSSSTSSGTTTGGL